MRFPITSIYIFLTLFAVGLSLPRDTRRTLHSPARSQNSRNARHRYRPPLHPTDSMTPAPESTSTDLWEYIQFFTGRDFRVEFSAFGKPEQTRDAHVTNPVVRIDVQNVHGPIISSFMLEVLDSYALSTACAMCSAFLLLQLSETKLGLSRPYNIQFPFPYNQETANTMINNGFDLKFHVGQQSYEGHIEKWRSGAKGSLQTANSPPLYEGSLLEQSTGEDVMTSCRKVLQLFNTPFSKQEFADAERYVVSKGVSIDQLPTTQVADVTAVFYQRGRDKEAARDVRARAYSKAIALLLIRASEKKLNLSSPYAVHFNTLSPSSIEHAKKNGFGMMLIIASAGNSYTASGTIEAQGEDHSVIGSLKLQNHNPSRSNVVYEGTIFEDKDQEDMTDTVKRNLYEMLKE